MGVLTRFGIGNASVELEVPRDVEQGETIEGTLEITGGSSPQDVERVYAAVRSKHDSPGEGGPNSHTVAEYTLVDEAFTIEPSDNRTETVEIHIPENTPVTTLDAQPSSSYAYPVWITTGLDVEWAVDPDDKDTLNVAPSGVFSAVHEAMTSELGFETRGYGVGLTAMYMDYDGHPFIVSYTPNEGTSFAVDEVDIVVGAVEERGLQLLVDVDLKGMSLGDNVRTERVFTETDVGSAATELRRIIRDATSN